MNRLAILSIILVIFCASCKKQGCTTNVAFLRSMYEVDTNLAISECIYNGERVYSVASTYVDGSGAIYSCEGERLGTCNYAWCCVDSICKQTEACERVFLNANNPSHQPRIDKYGIAD